MGFLWLSALRHAPPIPSKPRSPLACSARCPQFWLNVVYNAELPCHRADCFIQRWPSEGQRAAHGAPRPLKGLLPAASSTAARGGWLVPQSQEPDANRPLFRVEKIREVHPAYCWMPANCPYRTYRKTIYPALHASLGRRFASAQILPHGKVYLTSPACL